MSDEQIPDEAEGVPDRPGWPEIDPETGGVIMSHPIPDDPVDHGVRAPLKPGDWGDVEPPEPG